MSGSLQRKQFLCTLQQSLLMEGTDRRDEWSTDLSNDYQKGVVLASGQFGMVVAALGRDSCGKAYGTPRACVIKLRYVGRHVEKVLDAHKDEVDRARRVNDLTRRIVCEVYILNRLRHANIMHAHAVSLASADLTIILPRLYCLETLIQQYRLKFHGESMPADIIMRVIRQVCIGLDFLLEAGVLHRTVQAEHIYLTRSGTVKLGHFSAVKLSNSGSPCITPVGNREYMSFEKQFNLCEAESRPECLPYTSAADVWALGVLVLRMVSYFPNEKWQRLHHDFAFTMHKERMPFKWIIADLTQLRVRLHKACGNDDLRNWLSEKVLTVKATKRATPADLLQTNAMRRLCSATVEEDSRVLTDRLICVLDWPNRDRFETNRPNYDCLESKDIPAEFYWDERGTWKEMERAIFEFDGKIDVNDDADFSSATDSLGYQKVRHVPLPPPATTVFSGQFVFSKAHELLTVFTSLVEQGRIEWCDVLLIDWHVREGASTCMRLHASNLTPKETKPIIIALPTANGYRGRQCTVTVRLVGFE